MKFYSSQQDNRLIHTVVVETDESKGALRILAYNFVVDRLDAQSGLISSELSKVLRAVSPSHDIR